MELLLLIIFFQILLESFPVSSSGHVELLVRLTPGSGIPEFFDHFLHGPTILILMILFRNDWFYPLKKLLHGAFDKNIRAKDSYKNLYRIFLKICGFLVVTTSVAGIFWFIVKLWLQKATWFMGRSCQLRQGFDAQVGEGLFSSNYALLFGFCVTFVLLFLLWRREINPGHTPWANLDTPSNDGSIFFSYLNIKEPLSRGGFGLAQGVCPGIKKIFLIALAQALALLPGISRFASVYVTSRFLGINPRRAFQFTFLIQFPLIVPGFLLGFFKLTRVPNWQNFFSWQVNLTIFVATILSFFALMWVRNLAHNKKMGRFCFYMLIPIILTLFLIFLPFKHF
jgi:undecaprenyl pyrophosphate phosphatase UppP